MKKTNRMLTKLSALALGFMLLAINSNAQVRSGSIDLASSTGSAMYINDDGTGKELQILDGANTIEMWVKNLENQGDFCLFRFGSSSSNGNHSNRFSLVYENDSKFVIEIKRKRNGDWKSDQKYNFESLAKTYSFYNTWRHVALTFDGNKTAKLYIDGQFMQSLTHNDFDDGNYSGLFDSYKNYDANSYIGGTGAASDSKGKFYTGEVRLWKSALSASTISEYYDNEINRGHPNYSQLAYYYHGTDEYASGTAYKFKDCGGTYDGTQSTTSVRVSTTSGNTPPVRPPHFDESILDVSFTATNCQTDQVSLSWNSFHTSSTYLNCSNSSNRTPHYAIFRDEYNAGSPIYQGTTTSFVDTDVTGGDVHTYRLYTYWEIDGLAYYSDEYEEITGYAATEYAAPTSISATDDNCDGTITIDWSSSESPQYWRLERSINGTNFNAVSSTISGTTSTYTESTSDINSALTYYYRVKAYGTDGNGCTIVSSYSANADGYSADVPSGPSSVTVTSDTGAGSITIDWTEPAYNIADSWIIDRKAEGEADWTEIYNGTANTFTQSGSDIEPCVVYQYRVGAKNTCTGGVYYETKTASISYSELDDKIADFTASKGYYGDGVQLEWEINGTSSIIETFQLQRTIAGNDAYSTIATFDKDLVYRDYTALGNTLYEYKIQATASCNGNTVYSNDLTDIGFIVPFGIANGHVEYSGGNAVEDVKISIEPKSGMHGSSLYLDGSDDYIKTNDSIDLKNKSFTIEFWSKREETGKGDYVIFQEGSSSSNKIEIGYTPYDHFSFSCGSKGFSRPIDSSTDWIHWACVLDTENELMLLYLNGEQVSSNSSDGNALDQAGELYLGSQGSTSNNFKGYLDEIRVWDIARTADEIKENYNRVLNGNEEGMLAYWRCDEGFGNSIFDASYSGETFNKHDASFYGDVVFAEVIPDTDQLGIYASTDENGDYSLEYIPYVGSGEIFKVTPSIGQHQFSPGTRSIYVGDGAQTNNNLDFTDISSFSVSGKVTYENSTFPVEGVAVKIDGVHAMGSDNSPVRTDAEGKFTIDVPIGFHYISIEKDGHTFSQGHFPPLNEYDDVDTYEFTDDITGLEFVDNTKVKILGRVVGGTREGNKEVGFGLSTNNIGVAEIQFKAQNDKYDLDLSNDGIFSTITIETDPTSGEYEVELIPEKWEILKAGSNYYSVKEDDLATVDLEYETSVTYVYDSTFVENYADDYYEHDTTWYNYKLNYVIHSTPKVEVYNELGGIFDGDSILAYVDQATGEKDTLYLTENDPFNYPIFTQGKQYTPTVYVYEEYSNPDHPDGAINDLVPVENAEVDIINNLTFSAESVTGSTDVNGEYTTSFDAGLPNVNLSDATSFTKTLEVYVTVDGTTTLWGDESWNAYILGAKPIEGTNFITSGPEMVEVVLRDPPGSNSYAYIEKGSSYSMTHSWESGSNSLGSLDHTFITGMRIGVGGGAVGPMVTTDLGMDYTVGIQTTRDYNSDGNYTETKAFTKRIETSSDPEDVGSDADLYIGKAYNMYMTESKNLRLTSRDYCETVGIDYYPNDGSSEIVLGVFNGLAMDDSTDTYFIYSQKHIVHELIPELYAARNTLLQNASKYTPNFDFGHEFYGLNNDDNSFAQPKLDSIAKYGSYDTINFSYTFWGDTEVEMDSVEFLNDQITNWMNAIAVNEAEKVEAKLVQNISVDGSSGAYTEELEHTFDYEHNATSSRSFRFNWDPHFISIVGREGYEGSTKFNYTKTLTEGKHQELENSVKFGYVIDERDEGDYYSIDIKKEDGVAVFDEDSFSDKISEKDEYNNDLYSYIYDGSGATAKGLAYIVAKACLKKSNYFASAAAYTIDLGMFTYEMIDISKNRTKYYNKVGKKSDYDITGFDISSPIFTVRGGQSRCPHEPGEYTSFYVDSTQSRPTPFELHTATLQREKPAINVQQALITDVPEGETADFKLVLGNESESESDMWYELSILDDTNPDGAQLLIDGLSPEKLFLIPANGTLTKTLTLGKGLDEVFEYDSIGVVLHSSCQYNPADVQEDIGDTVYISAHFQPECTPVDIKNMQDNWILNYENNGEMSITLTDYDVNHSSLDMIQFQYKTLTGTAQGEMAYFTSENDSYDAYTGNKALLEGNGNVNFMWNASSLSDREYMIRARSTCSDGSQTEGTWYTGLFDTKPPKVFGTPEPGDGILEPGEDIKVRFDESLETGIITENNFSIQGVLNGTEISHNASLHFDGIDDYTAVNSGVLLTNKSFTIEFWLRRDTQSDYVVLSQGTNADNNLEIGFDASDNIYITIDGETFNGDASLAYNATYPWNAWHHYAVAYNHADKTMNIYADDQLLSQSSASLNYETTGEMLVGKSATATGNYLAGNMHDLRIWDDERSFSELYSNMSITLSGREAGAYRIWEMNEAKGNAIADKVRNQVMYVYAHWDIEPEGYAVAFNGSNQYLEMNSTQVVIDNETDFTIEFWFKGQTPTSAATLLANGKGDGVEDSPGSTENYMNLTAQTNGSIILNTNGYVFEAVTNNYFDNDWHHFALVVDRNSKAKAYIDNKLQNSTDANNVAQLAAAKMFIGARGYNTDPVTYAFDQHFAGSIDEVRFWNTSRTTEQLELYSNAKLSGEEFGLLGYYPFEYYENVMGVDILTSTLEDQWINPYGTNNGAMVAINSATLSNEAPEIKDARPVQNVAFDFVVNNDEIILTPTESSAKLENVILEISVKDVFDLNGNRLLSPANWTAYIDQNQVIWDGDAKVLEKELYEPMSFTATMVNLGGTSEEYTISNLPDWLTVSNKTGIIDPNETLEITFTVNEATNLGEYDENIYLTTSYGYNETLNLQLRVYEPEPEWSVVEGDYEYSMIVIGQLKIAGDYSADEYDKIAAFAGDECRGVANVQYTASRDAYYIFLTAYSNSISEEFTYKVWDASSGEIYTDVTPEIDFESNKLSGSISSPTQFECGYLLSSSIALNKGWKWVSFNRSMENYSDVNTLFEGLNIGDGDLIKNKSSYATYDAAFNYWFSSGLAIQAGDMYKVKMSNINTLDYEGGYIDADDFAITINPGWNRIGYVPQVNIEVNQALAAYPAQEGDLLKAQTMFAIFDGSTWLGSLSYLKPGEGYLLWSQTIAAVDFNFPNKSTLGTLKNSIIEEQLYAFASGKVNPYTYPGSVSITARINTNSLPEDAIIGAFVGEELRGVGTLNKQQDKLSSYSMITAFGNEKDNGDLVQFAMISEGEVYELTGNTTFESDNFQGNIAAPVELYLENWNGDQMIGQKVYPNPFKNEVHISFKLQKECKVSVEVYSTSGTIMDIPVSQTMEAGTHTITWNSSETMGAELPAGVYFINLKLGEKTYQHKLIKSN